MHRRMLAVLAISAAAAATVVPAPALAHGNHGSSPTVTVLSSSVGSPFNLELTRRGILVADGGSDPASPGQVSKLAFDGTLSTVVPDVVGASGVAASRKALAYTSTTSDPTTHENTAASVEIQYRDGTLVHADTLAYEKANNPDAVNTYGIANPTQCQSDLLEPLGGASYTGAIDSHAYSLARWGHSWLLADAGGNDLLKIDGKGDISTVAVFPPQQIKVTQAFLDANFPPDVDTSCLVGATYGFEPVPTDVEVGDDGYLYVTTLPGGAEDDSLGANGAVWRVSPWSGHVKMIASGFLGATNLALSNGKIYVTELFAGRVSVVKNHQASPYVDLPGALSIEAGRDGALYAGTFGAFSQSASTIVRIDNGHRQHWGDH
jgi:hypothetical protein